jgi:hypothetical protein
MKLQELLSRLDSEETPYYADDDFLYEFLHRRLFEPRISFKLHNNGFTKRPITQWVSYGHYVGTTAIYWNGEFICLKTQTSYQNFVNIQWVSEEVFNRVSDFVKSLIEKETCEPVYLDHEKEYGETYKLEFGAITDQILSDWAFYDGEKCKILRDKNREEIRKDDDIATVWIEQNSIVKQVHISELEFPVLLKDS